ncbi:hypothetical protein [Shinella sp. HZN7]|uniref:hypothetical protein n=1 Tax=Shinella sp. (strain HZN7) TaxID=879274 RepID=UPI000AB004B3|nr:hypothetical protein [Shinella sp. HZN7]
MGGQVRHGYTPPQNTAVAASEGQRINMVTAIRRTLDHELSINERVVLFGEDIGPKGGVHAVTLGLQEKFGARGCSIRRCRRKASSAGRWAWRWRG